MKEKEGREVQKEGSEAKGRRFTRKEKEGRGVQKEGRKEGLAPL